MTDLRRGKEIPKDLISLDEILERDGLAEDVSLRTFKKLVALRLQQEMQAQMLSKSVMAKRMGTSRAQLDRVLDPDSYNVTIETLIRAAKTLGKRLEFNLT